MKMRYNSNDLSDMTNKAPTLKDVALRAGVSQMAVSAVLNRGKTTSRVSEATRQRILAAIDDIGYEPDAVAVSLRHSRASAIGFYSGHGFIDPSDPIISEIFHGLHLEASKHEMDLLLFNGLHLLTDAQIQLKLTDNKVDGVVLLPRPSEVGLLEALGQSERPAVSIREPTDNLPCVVVDDAGMSATLARHLTNLGHKSVLYRRSSALYPSALQRCIGFHSASLSLGFTLTETTGGPNGELTQTEKELIADYKARKLSAIACCNDAMAFETIRYCRELGIGVPDELSVVGFDGVSIPGDLAGVELTTIHVGWLELGELAVRKVVDLIGDNRLPRRVVREASFVAGNTAGPVRSTI